MILTQAESDVKTCGEIVQNQVSIDTANINFISHLLTSNLYSKPLVSFFRETISNALDSNIEAGKKDAPILVLFERKAETASYQSYHIFNVRISIRDYGTGLSPERFDKIYKNIGSSTKRDSNDYIGMFGIGRFSCLAVSDNVEITSYYNGTKMLYLMYKSNGQINIDKVHEMQTEEPNGLEISLTTDTNTDNIIDALVNCQFFETVTVKSETSIGTLNAFVESFNKRRTKTFTYFSLLESAYHSKVKNYVRMGNVLYENPSNLLFRNSKMIVNVPMGSVDIIPSREKLQLTKKTEQTLQAAYAAAKIELTDKVNSIWESEDLTLPQYIYNRGVNRREFYIKDSNDTEWEINPEDLSEDINSSKGKIDGIKIPEYFKYFITTMLRTLIPEAYIYRTINPDGYRQIRNNYITFKTLIYDNANIGIKTEERLKKITVKYLKDTIDKPLLILKKDTKDLVTQEVKRIVNSDLHYTYKISEDYEFDFDTAFKILGKYLDLQEINDGIVPEDYNLTVQVKQVKEAEARIYSGYGYSLRSLDSIYNKNLVIIGPNTKEDQEYKDLSETFSSYHNEFLNITVATVPRNNYDFIVEHKPEKFILIDDLLSYIKPHPLMRKAVEYSIIQTFYNKLSYNGMSTYNLPIIKRFRESYKNVCTIKETDLLSTYVEHYKKMNWVRQYLINQYLLTEEDIKQLKLWERNENKRQKIVRLYTIKQLKKSNDKIGLTI